MAVGNAARANAFEFGADPGEHGIRRQRLHRDLAVLVAQASERRNHGGRTDTRCTVEGALGVRLEHFIDRNAALFDRHLHVAQQRQHAVARNPWEDSAAKGRRDDGAVDDEHDVHQPGLFHPLALDPIEPEHVVETLLLRLECGEHAAGVVAAALGRAGAAGERADVDVFGDEIDRAREIRAARARFDDEAERVGGPHAERLGGAEHDGTNVERGAVAFRDPVAIELHERRRAIHEDGRRNLGHGHALAGPVHAGVVGIGTEEHRAAVGPRKGLEALEDALAVVGDGRSRGHHLGAVGNNLRVAPFTVGVVGHQHVVAEHGTERRFVADVRCQPGCRSLGDGDGSSEHVAAYHRPQIGNTATDLETQPPIGHRLVTD